MATKKKRIKRIAKHEFLCSIYNYDGHSKYHVKTSRILDGMIMSFPLNEVFELPEINAKCVLAKSEEEAVDILFRYITEQRNEIYNAYNAILSEKIKIEKNKKENAGKDKEDILINLIFKS